MFDNNIYTEDVLNMLDGKEGAINTHIFLSPSALHCTNLEEHLSSLLNTHFLSAVQNSRAFHSVHEKKNTAREISNFAHFYSTPLL